MEKIDNMDFKIGDQLKFDDKNYIILENINYKNKLYFLLSTTEKPIQGVLVEYKIENNEIYINKKIEEQIKKDILFMLAEESNSKKN